MSIVLSPEAACPDAGLTLDLLAKRFGPMPVQRIRTSPPPGTATEADAIGLNEGGQALVELVDGVLLEKTMGFREAFIAGWLLRILGDFVDKHDLGIVLPSDAMMRLRPGRIRLPDVSFITWDRLPDRALPDGATFNAGPDLAVEVVSPSNTHQELEEKLADYFRSGARLVWYVYPWQQEVHVFHSADARQVYTVADKLDGGEVLPGFSLDVARLFAEPKPRGQ